jgi:hypothetical protein
MTTSRVRWGFLRIGLSPSGWVQGTGGSVEICYKWWGVLVLNMVVLLWMD